MSRYDIPEEVFFIAGRDEHDCLILENECGQRWTANPAKRRKRTERIQLPPAEYDDLRVRLGLVRSPKAGNYPAIKIGRSEDVYTLMKTLSNEPQEVFSVVLLDANNVVTGVVELFRGGLASTEIDPKLILAPAILSGSVSMILVHNHPSGNAQPSTQDQLLTDETVKAASLFGFRVLDHLVIGTEGQYTSLADQGMI